MAKRVSTVHLAPCITWHHWHSGPYAATVLWAATTWNTASTIDWSTKLDLGHFRAKQSTILLIFIIILLRLYFIVTIEVKWLGISAEQRG